MLEKMQITEEDYACLANGISLGVAIGILVGIFTDNIIFTFALGGVIGILSSLLHSSIKKNKKSNID